MQTKEELEPHGMAVLISSVGAGLMGRQGFHR